MKNIKLCLFLATVTAALLFSCNKKDYYEDGGLHDGTYNGTVMQYLESKPDYFDSLVKIIKYTNMESIFNNEEISFFAPADSSIRSVMEFANPRLAINGKPAITKIEDIKPAIWRKYLTRYLFKGAKSMAQYPQLDLENLSAFSGQMYSCYDGAPMNIGVVYGDANGVKYAGYRYVVISSVNAASPRDLSGWYPAMVASVNIKPANGYVHAIRYGLHYFGFNPFEFSDDLIYNN